MQQQGEYTINGSVERIWQALNDADALKASIPGCQSIEQVDAENLKATVRAKVGPVNAAFKVTIALTDVNAPYSYTLNGEVRGGAGVAKGNAQVQLEALPQSPSEPDTGPRTRLSYQVQASVGGKLAQVGSRLIDGAAKKMADDFAGIQRGMYAGRLSANWQRRSGRSDANSNRCRNLPVERQRRYGIYLDYRLCSADHRHGACAMNVSLRVNGESHTLDVAPNTLLVSVLREHLGLTGTHVGCDTSQCGACTIHVDGRAVKSCAVLAVQVQDAVVTIEGLAGVDKLHPMQQAFRDCHGLQCGFAHRA